MARKSEGQKAALAQTAQEVSGQVRVDASSTTTGSKSRRSTTSLQPSLAGATKHLEQTGFQKGDITSPSGVQVQVSRSKGGASASSEYSPRAAEFGDKNAPPVRRGVSGAASGEARWQVSQRPGQDAVQKRVAEAAAVRSSHDPITSHETLSTIRGLVNSSAKEEGNAYSLHARGAAAESRGERGPGSNPNQPALSSSERDAARIEARAASRAGARKSGEYRSSVKKVARAASAIARRDPSAAVALQAADTRQEAIGRADLRTRGARRRATSQSQDINTWSKSSTQGTDDMRSRARQGFVHTQQAGTDVSHETRMLELEHKQSRKEAENPSLSAEQRSGARATAGAATRGIPQLQARNRAAMTVNRRPMEETVGVQPANVRSALPPGTSARTGPNPKRGTGHGH